MSKKAKKQKNNVAAPAEEWDFSEGFGGLPDDIELSKNIGCASNGKSSKKKPKTGDKPKT
ncbi:hypothetical protein GCM10028791_32210 [Echinicola sediminis]